MFGALTSVLARECRSVVTGRMAGALFAGESNSLVADGTAYCCTAPAGRGALCVEMPQVLLAARAVSSGWRVTIFGLF